MAQVGTFLGIEHDLTEAVKEGVVRFWPKPSLIQKAQSIVKEARVSDYFSPATAAKYRGLINFMAAAMWKQAGKGGAWLYQAAAICRRAAIFPVQSVAAGPRLPRCPSFEIPQA